jgi:hypothetical protein
MVIIGLVVQHVLQSDLRFVPQAPQSKYRSNWLKHYAKKLRVSPQLDLA